MQQKIKKNCIEDYKKSFLQSDKNEKILENLKELRKRNRNMWSSVCTCNAHISHILFSCEKQQKNGKTYRINK